MKTAAKIAISDLFSKQTASFFCFSNFLEIPYYMTIAIQETAVDNQNDSPIYDLMGCKVKKVIKGSLYIQNGQKFIAK